MKNYSMTYPPKLPDTALAVVASLTGYYWYGQMQTFTGISQTLAFVFTLASIIGAVWFSGRASVRTIGEVATHD